MEAVGADVAGLAAGDQQLPVARYAGWRRRHLTAAAPNSLNAGVLSRVEVGDTATAFVVRMRGQRDRVNRGAGDPVDSPQTCPVGSFPCRGRAKAGRTAREYW
jgi:hypothetical protein